MKKKIILGILALVVLAGAALLIRQNLPEKRYGRHMIKARLYVKEGNYTAARLEYEKAYNATGEYTPYASLEVLRFTNRVNLQEGKAADALANTRAFLERHPRSREAKVILAELAFQTGDLETAFEAVHSAVDQDPDYFPARMLLTQARTRQSRLDLAEEQLRLLYKSHPDSLPAILPLAENQLRQGKIKEARGFLAKALADHPASSEVRMLMLDSWLLEGRADSAQAFLDSWKQGDPSLALPLSIRKAQIHALLRDFDRAEALLKPYMAAREDNLPAYQEMALIKAKRGQYDSAARLYRAMAEVKPAAAGIVMRVASYLHLKQESPAHALEVLKTLQVGGSAPDLPPLLAAAYVAMGQENKVQDVMVQLSDTARQALQSFVDLLDPPSKEFIGQWALVSYWINMRQPAQVAEAAREFHAKWPKSRLARTMWAGQLAGAGRAAEAVRILEGLEDPDMSHRISMMGLYLKAGEPAKAEAAARRILQDHPGQKGVNLFLGDLHAVRGDREKAAAHYAAELARDPDNLACLNNLAWEYGVVQGDAAKAQPYIDRMLAKKLVDPRILDTIGWILARNGKHEEALKYFKTALNVVPDYPVFLYHLGWTLAAMGKKDEARARLESALSGPAAFEERTEAEKLLAGL